MPETIPTMETAAYTAVISYTFSFLDFKDVSKVGGSRIEAFEEETDKVLAYLVSQGAVEKTDPDSRISFLNKVRLYHLVEKGVSAVFERHGTGGESSNYWLARVKLAGDTPLTELVDGLVEAVPKVKPKIKYGPEEQ